MDVDELVKKVYPPTTGEAVLAVLARNAGHAVSLEDLAIAAYGDTPEVWQYSHTDDWQWNAGSCIRKLRRRLCAVGLEVDIEAVRCQGYRLVERKARARPTRADMKQWQVSVLKRYDALLAEQPGLSTRQARDILAPTLRRRLPHGTLKNWLRKRKIAERSAP